MQFDITTIVEAVAALIAAIITAFTAAEQIYAGSGRGEEKKAYVIDWLRKHGVTVDESKLDALIEAAVFEHNKGLLTIGEVVEPIVGTTP